jgi:cell division protein FtsQ
LGLQVTKLVLSPRHAWQLRLSNGMVLELGREDMQQRLARFVEAYPYSLAAIQSRVKYVDLRYGNGFAVKG